MIKKTLSEKSICTLVLQSTRFVIKMSSFPLSSVDGAKYIWRNIWDNRNSTHDDSNWCLWWYNIFDKCVIFWISLEKIKNFGQETLYTFNLKCLLDPLVSYSTTYLVLGCRGIQINRDAHTSFTPDTYSRSSDTLPGQPRDKVSPVCLPREASGGHLIQAPDPPQLTPLNAK